MALKRNEPQSKESSARLAIEKRNLADCDKAQGIFSDREKMFICDMIWRVRREERLSQDRFNWLGRLASKARKAMSP